MFSTITNKYYANYVRATALHFEISTTFDIAGIKGNEKVFIFKLTTVVKHEPHRQPQHTAFSSKHHYLAWLASVRS